MAELYLHDDGEATSERVATSHPLPIKLVRPSADSLPVRPGVPLVPIDGDTGAMTDTAAHTIIAAQGTDGVICLTQLTLTNTHASTNTGVGITGLASGTTYHAPAPAGGGAVLTFNPPLIGKPGTALQATCLTTGSNTYASGSGFVLQGQGEAVS